MLNVTALLTRYNVAPPKPKHEGKRYHDNLRAARAAKTARTALRYAAAMGGQAITAPELATRLGISAVGCLGQMYRFERAGLAERAGTVEGVKRNPPILWRWVGR